MSELVRVHERLLRLSKPKYFAQDWALLDRKGTGFVCSPTFSSSCEVARKKMRDIVRTALILQPSCTTPSFLPYEAVNNIINNNNTPG